MSAPPRNRPADAALLPGIDFAPVLPLWLLAALGVLALLALVPAFLRRARGAPLRALAFALLLLALANPRLVEETRETRPDIALLVVDRSDSARIGDRAPRRSRPPAPGSRRAPPACRNSAAHRRGAGRRQPGHPAVRRHRTGAGRDPPRPPRRRDRADRRPGARHPGRTAPVEAPFHLLLPGGPGETDRRLRVIEAPGFGIVGARSSCGWRSRIWARPAGGGAARLTIRRDGEPPRVDSVPVGREHRIAIPIERGGPTVVELAAEARAGEVSELNNRAVVAITGVRDRLRVLLISGEPHAGERTWRRLLKADPGWTWCISPSCGRRRRTT